MFSFTRFDGCRGRRRSTTSPRPGRHRRRQSVLEAMAAQANMRRAARTDWDPRQDWLADMATQSVASVLGRARGGRRRVPAFWPFDHAALGATAALRERLVERRAPCGFRRALLLWLGGQRCGGCRHLPIPSNYCCGVAEREADASIAEATDPSSQPQTAAVAGVRSPPGASRSHHEAIPINMEHCNEPA